MLASGAVESGASALDTRESVGSESPGPVASHIEVLPEECRVQVAPRDHCAPVLAHESGAAQPPEQPLVPARAVANHLGERLDQIVAMTQPEEVVSQMVAERAVIGGGGR